jgi:hypothetical protein
MDELIQFLLGVLSAEDLATALELIGAMQDDPQPGASIASDSRNKGTKMINRDTVRELQSIRAAEEAVAPFVGPVLGMDSEFKVYFEALKKMTGQMPRGLYNSAEAAKAMFNSLRNVGARPKLALDTASADKMRDRFPGAFSIKQR